MLTFNYNLLSFDKSSKPISKESKASSESLYNHPHLLHDLFYCILVISILHFYFIFSFGSSIFIASCLFILARSLPEISQRALEESEARLFSTIKSKYVHKWSTFSAGGHDFKVHSIHVIDRDDSQRENLVIIHGHSAGSAHWECVVDTLASKYNVHVLDVPGWGRSSWPNVKGTPEELLRLQVESVAHWLKLHVIDSKKNLPIVVAHSHGALLAVHIMKEYPNYFQKLLLVAPAGLLPVMPDLTYWFGFYFRYLTPQRIARTTGRLGYVLFKAAYQRYAKEDPRFADYYYQLAAGTARHGKADLMFSGFCVIEGKKAWWSRPTLDIILQSQTPTALFWGERDPLLPARFGHLLRKMRPNTPFYIIKDAKHNPAHSKQESFCDALFHYLENRSKNFQTDQEKREERNHFQVSNQGSEVELGKSFQLTNIPRKPFCLGCNCVVRIQKSCWQCKCGIWSFLAFSDVEKTRQSIRNMECFLEELYINRTFNALSCEYIRDVFNVESSTVYKEVCYQNDGSEMEIYENTHYEDITFEFGEHFVF